MIDFIFFLAISLFSSEDIVYEMPIYVMTEIPNQYKIVRLIIVNYDIEGKKGYYSPMFNHIVIEEQWNFPTSHQGRWYCSVLEHEIWHVRLDGNEFEDHEEMRKKGYCVYNAIRNEG